MKSKQLLREQKITIDPVDERSSEIFVSHGFRVIAASEFNINNIIHS